MTKKSMCICLKQVQNKTFFALLTFYQTKKFLKVLKQIKHNRNTGQTKAFIKKQNYVYILPENWLVNGATDISLFQFNHLLCSLLYQQYILPWISCCPLPYLHFAILFWIIIIISNTNFHIHSKEYNTHYSILPKLHKIQSNISVFFLIQIRNSVPSSNKNLNN